MWCEIELFSHLQNLYQNFKNRIVPYKLDSIFHLRSNLKGERNIGLKFVLDPSMVLSKPLILMQDFF